MHNDSNHVDIADAANSYRAGTRLVLAPRTSRSNARRLRLALVAVAAAVPVVAGLTGTAAAALPPDGTEPTSRPNLALSGLSTSWTGSAWSVRYTVLNNGDATARASVLGVAGTGQSIPQLAVGARSSGTVTLGDSGVCTLNVNFTADRTNVVAETNESDNYRSAVGSKPGCPPRYRVTADYFYVDDESGPDWSGSDEPYWTFNAIADGGTGTGRHSQVFGDTDTGETKYFSSTDSCLFGCGTTGELGPNGVGLSVQLWEQDAGAVDQIYYDMADAFAKAGPLVAKYAFSAGDWVDQATPYIRNGVNYVLNWANNDNLGTQTFAYSKDYLAQAMPSIGTSVHDTRTFSDGNATYTLHLTVRRIG